MGLRTRTGSIDYAVLVSDPAEFEECNLLVLQDHDDEGPVPWFEFHNSRNNCFIFGNDWTFEILLPDDGADFCDTDASNKPGGILIEGEVAEMYVGRNPRNSRNTPGYINVKSWEPAEQLYDGLIGASKRWKIWESETERTRTGGKPLLSFNC